jgi:hypothetical protein
MKRGMVEMCGRYGMPTGFPTPLLDIKADRFRESFYLLLLCFFITFFLIPLTLVLHHERLDLYKVALNDERRGNSPLSIAKT